MNRTITEGRATATFLAIAATLAGVGALIWRNMKRTREARALRVTGPERPGLVPTWARASAIVASSASALLLLVRDKT